MAFSSAWPCVSLLPQAFAWRAQFEVLSTTISTLEAPPPEEPTKISMSSDNA